MAQPFYPSYSTTSGDGYGYSERAGSDSNVLRSQYGGTYRGEPSFEPARYSAPSPYRGAGSSLSTLDRADHPIDQPNSAPSTSRQRPTQYRVPTPIAAGAPTPYTGIYTAPLDLSRRSLNGKTGNAPAIYPRESKQHPPITSLAPKSLWESEELVDHGASSVYGLGTTRQLTATVEKMATRDLSSAPRQRRPKTPPLVRPGPTYEKELSARNCGKLSVSRRLPEGERLRYHIPGYMGFVKSSQFHHGGTYGKTTRKCIEDHHPAAQE